MRPQQFWLQLAIISASTAILLFFLNRIESLQPYSAFSWICLAAFILLTILMYKAGQSALKSQNKNDFTNTTLGFMMGKMLLAGIIIISYNKLMEPQSKIFILPFFIVYVIYTVFETYFMMRLAKS